MLVYLLYQDGYRAGAPGGRVMRTRARRRSLRRAWRILTWPLSGHVALAMATGLACGIVDAHYPMVISPPYAAILGTLVLYPAMVAMWWRLNRPRKRGR